MNYTLAYHPNVRKQDLVGLDERIKMKIRTFLTIKLIMAPELFSTPLKVSLRGHRKALVGNYRILFRVQKSVISILAIQLYSAMR